MDLVEIIYELETKLQQPDTRKSKEALDDLISDDLVEFGSSGQVYTKEDVLNNLPNAREVKFVMTDFSIVALSPDVVLSHFRTEKSNLETGETTKSLRSSIWRQEEGKWKMLFHQGTPTQ